MKEQAKAIAEAIKGAKEILIITHVNPDGDCVGSASALAMFIENEYNVTPTVAVRDSVAEKYRFLNKADSFVKTETIIDKDFDTVIAVDCACQTRMTEAIALFNKAKIKINIDHHITNPLYGDINYVRTNLSSTGEAIYEISKSLGWKLTQDIADSLYIAILTDTGGFQYENTQASTFLAVADLMNYGINPTMLYKKAYESKPLGMVKLHAIAAAKAEFVFNGKVGYTIITLDDMKNTGALNEYTDGIVEVIREVDSVDIAFIIKETPDNYSKISLRSKEADVSKIAMRFSGGGHRNAAGCTIKKPYNIALEKLLDVIKEETGLC